MHYTISGPVGAVLSLTVIGYAQYIKRKGFKYLNADAPHAGVLTATITVLGIVMVVAFILNH
jgi:hypothetical protein